MSRILRTFRRNRNESSLEENEGEGSVRKLFVLTSFTFQLTSRVVPVDDGPRKGPNGAFKCRSLAVGCSDESLCGRHLRRN